MTDGPLISIIVTYYSYAEYLSEALASINAQTYRNFEVVVVDDGAPGVPVTQLIQPDFQFPIRIFAHEKNLGLPSARNTGVINSKGRYLVILDSDDLIEPTFLEKTLGEVIESGADGAYTQVRMFGARNYLWIPDVSLISVMSGVPGPTSFLMKREVFEKAGGFKPHLPLNSDHEFWLSALANGATFSRVDQPLYKYRKHPTSLSASNRCQWWRSIPVLLNEHRELYEKHLDEILIFKEKHFRLLEQDYDRLYDEWLEVHNESERVHSIHEEAMQRIAFSDQVFRNPVLRLIFFLTRRLFGRFRNEEKPAKRPGVVKTRNAVELAGDTRRAVVP